MAANQATGAGAIPGMDEDKMKMVQVRRLDIKSAFIQIDKFLTISFSLFNNLKSKLSLFQAVKSTFYQS